MAIMLEVQCVLFSIPMLLHLTAILVIVLTQNGMRENQRYLFINLSASEALICFIGIIKRICKIYALKTAGTYVRFVQAGVATFAYYFIMMYLTLDRFCEVFLNIKYPTYFPPSRTLIVIGIIWSVSVIFAATLCGLNTYNPDNPQQILTYFYFVFGVLCIVVSLITYSYILRKIYVNKTLEANQVSSISSSHQEQVKQWKKLIQSMYLPVLLLISFFIFVIIPEITYFIYDLHQLEMSDALSTVLTTSYFIAYTSDVFIYVLGSKHIRKTLLRKLKVRNNKIGDTSTTTPSYITP
eukprot:TCONS_00062460-protein